MKTWLMAATAAFALAAANPAAARPFTAKDLASLERVSSPAISPDGRYVAYASRTTDWDANGGVSALKIVDLSGDPSKPLALLTGEKGGTSPSWSTDGRWLYFISRKSGSAQVWRSDPTGAVRQQLTAFPIDVAAFKLARDGQTLIVGADVYPDCATLACTKERDDAKGKEKGSAIEVKSGQPREFDIYLDDMFVGLFRVDLTRPGAPAEGVPFTKGFAADVSPDDIALSPDGRTAYFASSDPAVEPSATNAFSSIYEVPTDGTRAPKQLIGADGRSFGAPALSPDGTRLAYIAAAGPVFSYNRTGLMLMNVRTGRTSELAPRLDADFSRLDWSPDGRTLLVTGEEQGQTPLYRIDAATGAATKLVTDGVVSGFDASRSAVAYVKESLASPQQLFVQQAGGPARQLTHAGDTILAQTPLSPSEQFSFPGWNGETVSGYVTRPYGYVEGKKYPIAFLIHGGPHGSFGNAWSYRWNPQVWAGMGYAVVTVDFHGSSGYGEQFGRSIIGHWGDRPLEDLQKGYAFALSRYPYLDSSRACALGGSYGGYMISWIASQWNEPWRCLVDHAGVFDVRSQAWVMDLGAFVEEQFGSVKDIREWERFNPAAYASQWKKPILVIHGGKDFRVPTEQGIAAYNAARRAGVPTKLVIFPDENHWVLKPQNSVQWYRNVEDWMDRWTGNVPPAASDQAGTAATK